MPRKPAVNDNETELEKEAEEKQDAAPEGSSEEQVEKLTRFLAAVLEYLSDDEVEVIDIEYLLTNTEGLREWWEDYQENNRNKIEQEIRDSLGELSLEELQSIHEKIKGK
ncbi:hypothetical protein [Bacillus benzoevorans]|uniref:Uncharacterized protein n=1 Tax=Bacillus benzoevorans TaxID=1456 RepID=A0A7X0HWX2_9BACI|nr:hypothetical protein [Bacillus benzoevorans]MBB6447111.1 hypothetical protein [Bacillus benzoevorans]